MPSDSFKNRVGSERIDDRQIAELIGITHGIIADGQVNQAEVEYLQKWLEAKEHVTANPVVRVLRQRIDHVLLDGIVDAEEAADLMATLTAFAGGDFERGELTKSSSLPFCEPFPVMTFAGVPICFTGTFAFGTRRDCENAAVALGAQPGSLTEGTRYLVVGAYATDSWSQSAFGRKIEKAVSLRSKGRKINIVGEAHWSDQMAASGFLRSF